MGTVRLKTSMLRAMGVGEWYAIPVERLNSIRTICWRLERETGKRYRIDQDSQFGRDRVVCVSDDGGPRPKRFKASRADLDLALSCARRDLLSGRIKSALIVLSGPDGPDATE
jgi:hypothetical protein